MHLPHPRPISPRRLLLLGGVFALSVLSCGREPTGPSGIEGIRWSRGIAWNAEFPAGFSEYLKAVQAAPQSAPTGAGDLVAFTRVRILLHFPDGSVALDQIVEFPAGATEVPVTLNIPLPASAPSGGVPLSMTLAYQNAAGETVFRGGPVTVTAVPATPGQGPPAPSPVTVPLQYTGPGATTATRVRITPREQTVNTGQAFSFTADALDAAGNVLSGVPILFSSQNPLAASINTVTGAGTAGGTRALVPIEAKLLTGPVDIAQLTITAPASRILAVSGSGQTAAVGATLALPIVVQANATDGLPAPGVTVTFAAQNGGSVGNTSVVTGTDGRASTTWRLGPNAGDHTLSATATGLIGSPLTFTATARSTDAVRLQFAQQPPASVAAGVSIAPAITVRAADAATATATGFVGQVSVALGAGAPVGAVLTGSTTITAAAGIATFSDLKINVPGTYTLVASSGPLTEATSSSFQVVAGNANRLIFQEYPVGSAVAGAVLSTIRVSTRDALGNPNTTFSGPVTLTANGPTLNTGAGTSESASSTDTASAEGANADVVMTGPITVNAVNGVATFSNIQLNAAGSYTLTATSTGLTSVTGLPFTVTPGTATVLELVSGGGQSAPGAAALANPVVVKVTDGVGNGIAGKTVTFTPAAGSGTANPTSAVTTAAGLAQTSWTIGPVAGAMTLNVSGTNLTPNPLPVTATATTTAGPGPATQLAFTTQPSNRAAGLALFPAVVVTAKDALGATATSFTGLVTVSILNNVGSSTLLGTTQVNAVAGVATFNNLSLTNVGTGYTLQATSGAMTAPASSGFNITPSGANSILVESGNSQSGTAGTALPTEFVARIIDAFGNAVPGVNVTWAVTAGGGTLAGTTSTTDANGRVRTTLTLGPAAGSNTVTVTSTGLTGSPLSFTATGVAGTGAALAFGVQPTSALAGAAITPAFTVAARDANNNIVTSFTGQVTLTFGANPGASVFTGTTAANAIAGVATFPGIFLNKIGTGYTIVASFAGLTPATSAPFNITAAAANAISAETGTGQSGVVGSALAQPFVVRVVDAFGNPVAGTTVTWAVAGGGGSLAGTTTTTDANGRAQTTLTLGTVAGANTVTATSTGLAGSPVLFTATATPGSVTQLVFTGQPTNTTANAFTPTIVVEARDAANNLVTNFTDGVSIQVSTNPNGATVFNGVTGVSAVGGVATFPGGVQIIKAGTGYTLTATSAGVPNGTSAAFNVTAGPALLIFADSGDAQTAIAGAPVTNKLVGRITDQFSNPVSGHTTVWSVTGGGGSLTATTNVTDVKGRVRTVWTLGAAAGGQAVLLDALNPSVGTIGFTATATAGAATQLVVTTQPQATQTAGTSGTAIVVTAKDANNNVATTFTGNVAMSIATGPGGATIIGPTSVSAAAGVATFGGVSFDKAGAYTLSFAAAGPITVTSSGFTVGAGAAANIVADGGTGQSGTSGAALAQAFVVRVTDTFGNPVAGTAVTFSVSGGGGSVTTTGTTTDVNGRASTTLTLGNAPGANTVTATSGSLVGSPVTFTATANAGTATQLVFTGQPSGAQAGASIAPAIVVTARDALGNTATSFGGTVAITLANNPGSATLSGTASVSAIAGVATFSGLSLDKVGIGYTLSATAGALTATSSGFTIVVGAANSIAAESGTGQSATVGTALAAPFVVRVTDALGNAVGGITVSWAVTAGGGSLSSASGSTDVNGRVQTTLTLGGTAGTNTVTATAGSLVGSPVTFNATASAGVATKLVFLTGPSNVTAGIPITASPVVQAQDANSNPVTSFVGSIAIAITTNPGGATLIGSPVTAVTGSATFTNLRLNKTGVGYVLTASSGALTAAVSGAFNVTPAPASVLSVVSGNNQTALATAAVASSLVAKVVDSLGNVVPGVPGTWAVATGGGSLNTTVSTSNAAGEFSTGWTLGTTAGAPQSVTLTVAGVTTGSPLTFNATATSALGNKVWTGANGTDLADPLNWSPPGAPVTTDELVIQAGGPTPALLAAATFKKVTLAPGATLNLNGFTLTITGDVDAGTTITGSGSSAVVLSGTGASLKGSILVPVTVTGTYTLSGNATVGGDLNIVNSGSLDLATFTMTAQANFSTQNSGTITMTQSGSALNVTGNASFGGGAETGKLLNGTVQVAGNFSQSGDPYSYETTGSHLTYLGGATQSIAFTDLTGSSRFNHLSIENTTTNATTLFFANSVAVGLGVVTLSGSVAVVRDSITDPNDRWGIPTVRFTGASVKIGNKLGTAVVRFGPNTTTLLTNATLGGSAIVESSGVLVLGGRTLAVDGDFTTMTGGRLNMTNGADVLDIAGNATFGGGSQTGLLTAGSMQVGGNLAQVNAGAATELVATQTHTIILDGNAAQTITLADADTIGGSCLKSCLGSMTVNKSGGTVTFGSPAKFTGNLSVGGTLTAFTAVGTAGNPRQVGVVGTFSTSATAPVHITHLGLGGVYARGAATTVDTITFAGTGQSIPAATHGEVRVRGTVALGGNVTTTGGLTVNGGSLTINGHTATVQGTFATTGTGALIMTGAADVLDVTGTTTFSGGPGSLTNGTILARGNFAQLTNNNAFSAVGPHITKFVGTGNQTISLGTPDSDGNPPGAGNACTASCFANVEVSKATGRLDFASHAKMMGSFTVLAQTDSLVANNKRIVVGGNFTNSTAPTRLTLLSLGGTTPVAPTAAIDTLIYWGNTTIVKLPTVDLQVWGSSVITSSGTLAGDLRVFGSGAIAFNAPLFIINGNFSTNGGTNTFSHGAATDTVRVLGNVSLTGGVSTPSMGRLEVLGDLTIGTQPLIASGTHVTALIGTGAGTQTLNWGAAFVSQGFQHLHFGGSKAKAVVGTPKVFGNVELYSSLTQPITGVGATVNIGGNLTDSSWVSPDVTGNWRVQNTGLFGTAMVRAGYMQTNLTITGTAQFPPMPSLREGGASVQLANSLAFQGVTRVTGNVTVSGASGLLDLSASVLQVYGTFLTASGGRLESNQNADYLYVTGSATFAGGTSILTDGTLEVLGNFTQSATATAFTADTTHYTIIGDYTAAVRAVRESVRPRTKSPTPAQQAAIAAGRERHLALRRALNGRREAARAAGLATGHTFEGTGSREVAPGVQQLGNLVSASAVTFANPGSGAGASHFGTWEITENVLIASDVVAGIITNDGDNSSMVTGTNHLITSISASVTDLTFNNARWFLDLKAVPGSLDGVKFTGMNTTVDQFTVQGDGLINPTLSGWQFVNAPTTGTYMRATDTAVGAPQFFVSVASIQPAGHGGKIALVGDAGTNWLNTAVATWTNPNESSSWDDVTAWDIGVVPDEYTDVILPATSSSWPTLNGNRSVRSLTMQDDGESAGNINLNDFTLLVHGNISVPVDFGSVFSCGESGAGTVEVRSATASVKGRFCKLTVAAGAVATLTGNTFASRNVTVLGSLVLGEFDLDVAVNRAFATAGSGTVTMTEADGRLYAYDAVFGGGSTVGLLTAGQVIVDGSLTVTAANAYAASGMHLTTLDANARVVGLRESGLRADASDRNQRRAVVLRARATARAARDAATAARLKRAGPTANVRTPATRPTGAAPVNIEASYVDVSFTNTTGNQFGRLELHDYINIVTPIKVAKSARLASNAYVEGTGRLIVTDTLLGHQYSTLATAGVELLGFMLDSGTFNPDTTFYSGTNQYIPAVITGGASYLDYNTVVVSGTGARAHDGVNYYSINNDLKVVGGGQLRIGDAGGHTSVYVYGNFATEGSGALRMSDHDSTWLKVYGDTVKFSGGSTEGLLNKGELYVGGKLIQAGNTKAFSADKGHRTAFGGSSHDVTFTNPSFTASHFGDLIIEDDSLHFHTDAFIAGALLAQSDGYGKAGSSNALITSRGAKATRQRFYNTRWKIVPGDSIENMTQVEFTAMTPTSTYFTLERHGTGVLPTFDSWVFSTVPTSGKYMEVNDLTPGGDVLTVSMTDTDPNVHGGRVTLIGGALISGWTSGLVTAVASGNWSSPSTWDTGVPLTSSIAVIPTGFTVTLNTPGISVVGLEIQGTGVLAQGAFDLNVNGSIATDTLVGGITCSTGVTYQPDAITASVRGRFCKYHSGGTITLNGRMTTSSDWHVHDGTFTFNGHRVDAQHAWVGSGDDGAGAGVVVMENAADSLIVADSMLVGDASNGSATSSQPTAGFIQVNGNFRQTGANGTGYWQPANTAHKLRLAGTGQVVFQDTTDSWLGTLEVTGTRTFASPVRVEGNLRNAGTITGASGRIRLAANRTLTGPVGSAVTIHAMEIGGVFADSGGFSPDTAVFTGGTLGDPQIIPDTVGAASQINLKSVRINGAAQLLPKSLNTNWLLNGKVTVHGSLGTGLIFGGGGGAAITIADSLITRDDAILKMEDAGSSVTVNGAARFAGSSTSGTLTAGTLTLLGDFTQANSLSAFAPSGNHATVLAGSAQTVTFAFPANSFFHNLTVNAGATVTLASDVGVRHVLARGAGASTATITSSGPVRSLAAQGLSISGGPTAFNNVRIFFEDGASAGTLDGVTWTGFSGYTGALIHVMRTTGGPFTFSGHNFSAVTGLGAGGRYLRNEGSQAITMASANPSPGINGTHYANTGSGSITWP